jgi:tetratricopeptide (TPR) repeat protein
MADPTSPSDDRIQDLERRLEADPSSRLFLQLAEEYRRKDRLEDAVGVLEKGLEVHPNHPSAKVALGRCQLALGRAEVAAGLFSEVLAQDPTQMVANKLLVEAYLELGRMDQAEERLRDYRQLNPGDPEIETLEERLRQPVAPPATSAEDGEADPLMDLDLETEGTEAPLPHAVAPTVVEEPSGEDPLFDVDLSVPAASDLDLEASLELEVSPLIEAPTATEDPLADLVSEAPAASPQPEPIAAPAPAPEAVADPILEAAEPVVSASSAGDDPFGDLLAAGPAPSTAEALPADDPLADISAAPPASPSPVVPVAETPAFEAEPEDAAPPSPSALPDLTAEEAEDSAPYPSTPRRKEPTATLTLGRLYLQQGHREEAERVFMEVLERDPGNAAALEALADLARRDREEAATAAPQASVIEKAEHIPEPVKAPSHEPFSEELPGEWTELPGESEEATPEPEASESATGAPEKVSSEGLVEASEKEAVAEVPPEPASAEDLAAASPTPEEAMIAAEPMDEQPADAAGGVTARRIAALQSLLHKLKGTETHVS